MTDIIFLQIAKSISNLSKCCSRKVGSVLVKEGRIISTGYNGTPSGFINCNELFSSSLEGHHEWSLGNEIHAELNCILWAAKNGVNTDNSVLYTTLEPCQQCLKNIIQAGVKKIVYSDLYDKTVRDVQFVENMLKYKGIELTRMLPE